MNLIDTHSHLYAEEFDENRDSLIRILPKEKRILCNWRNRNRSLLGQNLSERTRNCF